MNTRCYRCGWSFSLSREALEEAAVGSAGQKAHVIHCPRCRQAISIPMDQIMRALPPGWTPSAAASPAASEAEPVGEASDEADTAADNQAAADRKPASEPESSNVGAR